MVNSNVLVFLESDPRKLISTVSCSWVTQNNGHRSSSSAPSQADNGGNDDGHHSDKSG